MLHLLTWPSPSVSPPPPSTEQVGGSPEMVVLAWMTLQRPLLAIDTLQRRSLRSRSVGIALQTCPESPVVTTSTLQVPSCGPGPPASPRVEQKRLPWMKAEHIALLFVPAAPALACA